ncbi:MAG: AbrB/MazE/SpoVT family DNA-binding domain-containing protein [Candidatus Heimdallarchaeota archaeon]
MSSKIEAKIGSKGEIYPPKEIRDVLNWNPGDKILLEIVSGELRIRKIPRLEELLHKPMFTKKTVEAVEKVIDAERKDQEQMSLKDL